MQAWELIYGDRKLRLELRSTIEHGWGRVFLDRDEAVYQRFGCAFGEQSMFEFPKVFVSRVPKSSTLTATSALLGKEMESAGHARKA